MSIANWFQFYWSFVVFPVAILAIFGILLYAFGAKKDIGRSNSGTVKGFKQSLELKTYLKAGSLAALAIALPIADFYLSSIFKAENSFWSGLVGLVLIIILVYYLLRFIIRRGREFGGFEVLFVLVTYVLWGISALLILSSLIVFFPNLYL